MKDTILKQWQDYLISGRLPYIELELKGDEYLLCKVNISEQSIDFSFDSNGLDSSFDGYVVAHNDNYYSINWVDVDGYTLDNILEIIISNLQDGYISTNNLWPEDNE